jgi:hypothetical protein
MSTVRANSITNSAGSGAPDFPNGITVAGGTTLSAIATQAQAEAGTDNTTLMTPLRAAQAIASLVPASGWTFATPVYPSTSISNVDFTGIPSTAEQIIVMIDGPRPSSCYMYLGDSGGFETSGYAGNNDASTARITLSASTNNHYGSVLITKLTGNTWVCLGSINTQVSPSLTIQATKTLSDTLTSVRISSVGGNFVTTSGVINVGWM